MPAPGPPSGVVPATIVSSSTRFSPRPPDPVPVVAVTVRVGPLPVTDVIAPPATPPERTSAKSPASTPVTDALKVTVHVTVPALVGLAAARATDRTVGGVIVTVTGPAAAELTHQVARVATTRYE